MSDSEEFLSAEEDYEEDGKETISNHNKTNCNKSEKSKDQEKGKIELKTEKTLISGSEFVEKSKNDGKALNKNSLTQIFDKNIEEIVEKTESLEKHESDSNGESKNGDELKKVQKNEELKHSQSGEIEQQQLNLKETQTTQLEETCEIENTGDKVKVLAESATNLKIKEKEICAKIDGANEKINSKRCENKIDNINKSSLKDDIVKKPEKKIIQNAQNDKKRSNVIEDRLADKDDNWDFDDWGSEDKLSAVTMSKEEAQPLKNENLTEDNWNFDSWVDGTETSKNKEIVREDNKERPSQSEEKDVGWDDFGDDEWIGTNEISKSNDLMKKEVSKKNEDRINISKPKQSVPKSFEELAKGSQNNASWSGWNPWGGVVTSFLSTATEGVTSLTTHVSQVLESSIGIPEPEELLKINQKLEELQVNPEPTNSFEEKREEKPSALIGIVSGVTTIGNKVITGGLDTLEGIGKKTMNILQENDPLLLNKRRIIGLESSAPNLSQVLREAKEKSEEIERNLKQAQKQAYKKQLHFETLFDHYYGLVHLEALEMLSRQCDIKIQSLMSPLSGKALEEMKETLNEVKELCELDESENDDNDEPYTPENLQYDLKMATQDFGIPTDFTEIIECWRKNVEYLKGDIDNSQELFEKGLRCLAETCALQMNKMHKFAELLIIKESHSTVNEADSLVQITSIFSRHLKGVANKFGGKLNTFEQTEEVKTSITNIFLEVYNSISYVQSAFTLFIPILQVGAA